LNFLSSISRDHSRCWVLRLRSIGDWLNFMNIFSISIVDLLANLLWKSEVNSLARWSSKLCDTFLFNFDIVHNLRNSDAFFSSEIFAADDNKVYWLVNTSLDWFRVGNLDSRLNRGNNWNIVASLLGDFLTVVVSVAMVSVSWGWLADSDHLSITYLLVWNFHGFSSGIFCLLLVRVGADLVINHTNAFSTDSAGNWVTLLFINDDLGGDLYVFTNCFESWSANLSRFNYIHN